MSPVVAHDKGQPADRARVGEPLLTSRTLSAWLSLSGSEGCHLSSCWLVGGVEMGGKVDSAHGDRLPCQPGVGTTAHGGSLGSRLMKPWRWGRGGWTMPSGHPHACTGPGPARQRARRAAGMSSGVRIRGSGGKTEPPGADWTPGGRAWRPVNGTALAPSRRSPATQAPGEAREWFRQRDGDPHPARETWGAAASRGEVGGKRAPPRVATRCVTDGTAVVPVGRGVACLSLGLSPGHRDPRGRFPCEA